VPLILDAVDEAHLRPKPIGAWTGVTRTTPMGTSPTRERVGLRASRRTPAPGARPFDPPCVTVEGAIRHHRSRAGYCLRTGAIH
jgi:hypothetical protein